MRRAEAGNTSSGNMSSGSMSPGMAPSRTVPVLSRIPDTLVAGWSIGTIGPVTLLYVVNYAGLFVMTALLGIPPALAGGILFGTRMAGMGIDLAVGAVSDQLGSGDAGVPRWGRRRPFMLAGAILAPAGCAMLFNLPDGVQGAGAALWAGLALVIFFAGHSAFNVPYLAMPVELTRRYNERTRLLSARVLFVALSGLLGVTAARALVTHFGDGADAYGRMAAIMAGLCCAAMLACVASTGRAHATAWERPRIGFTRQVASVFDNRAFVVLLAAKLLSLLSVAAVTATMFLFTTQVLRRGADDLFGFGVANSAGIVLSLPFWVLAGRLVSKQSLLAAAIGIGIPLSLSWLLATPGETVTFFYARAFFSGVGVGGTLLMGQSMLADAIECDHFLTGLRREGLLTGLYLVIEKAAAAAGPLVMGLLLGVFGYQRAVSGAGATQEALRAIVIGITIVPAAAALAAILILRPYPLPAGSQRSRHTPA